MEDGESENNKGELRRHLAGELTPPLPPAGYYAPPLPPAGYYAPQPHSGVPPTPAPIFPQPQDRTNGQWPQTPNPPPPQSWNPGSQHGTGVVINNVVRVGGGGPYTSHGLHLFLTIISAGLWLPVWIVMTIVNSSKRNRY